jgi:hypothetical protein
MAGLNIELFIEAKIAVRFPLQLRLLFLCTPYEQVYLSGRLTLKSCPFVTDHLKILFTLYLLPAKRTSF